MTAAGKEPGTAAHQVFISYASENINSTTSDRQVADQICSALESQGIRCWIAHRDILPGDAWMDAISDAVDQAKIVILVFSANTENSKWVKDEIGLALEENKKIIPFRIQDVYPQRALKLLKARCQWMDAFTKPQEKHMEQLVETVLRHLCKTRLVLPKDEQKQTEIVKKVIREEKIKPKKHLPHKQMLIAVSIIILFLAAVFLINQWVKKEVKPPGETSITQEEPAFIKEVKSKGAQVKPIGKDSWEAYYPDYDITMVYIPPGEFMMGQTEEEKKWLIDQSGEKVYNSYYTNETPLHKVYLEGYWMGKYEVTFAQYDRYCNDIKKEKPGDEGWGRENRPVINVSWDDAAAYCEWLSQKTGLRFNLPTEAQWEKAARGNDQRKYPWGSRGLDKDLANFSSNVGKTAPVGSYPAGASPYGLLDMAGNVWEWCSDWFETGYYKNSPLKNPAGPDSGSGPVIRGGSWYSDDRNLRCAYRYDYGPSDRSDVLGFRLRQDI